MPLCLAAVLLFAAVGLELLKDNAPLVFAQSAPELEYQIQNLEEEIRVLQQELNKTTRERQTLQSAIRSLDLNIQKLTASINLTKAEMRKKDEEIRSLSGSIENTAQKISEVQDQIGKTLRELGQLNDRPLTTVLLSGTTLSAFFDEAMSLSALREKLRERVEYLSSLKTDLETGRSTTEAARRDLAVLQARLADERRGLEITKVEEQKLLKETRNQESRYQALIAEKQAEKIAFETALFELSARLGLADRGTIPPPRAGTLRWPLDNVFVTQEFGKTSASGRLYVSGYHDGIDLRASVGTPVRAALSGTVLEINYGAVPNCQYGKWVIIRHNNGLATLYAHLSDIRVAKGDSVETGGVIGYSGNTGYATGPHLHLTVYAAQSLTFKQFTCRSGPTVVVPIAAINGYLDPISYLPAP